MHNIEPVEENNVRYDGQTFIEQIPTGGFVNVNPEFAPGGTATGRYHVYMVTPIQGTSTFYVELDSNGIWTSQHRPGNVDPTSIVWIGEQIAKRGF